MPTTILHLAPGAGSRCKSCGTGHCKHGRQKHQHQCYQCTDRKL
jgi:hypothetical protein